MSASFTLDAIRDAADKKYANTEIYVDENTTVRLVNPLRLKKADRDSLVNIQKDLTSEDGEEVDVDQAKVFANAIRLVAENKGAADRMLALIGDDLAMLAEIFDIYGKATSLGEASASVD